MGRGDTRTRRRRLIVGVHYIVRISWHCAHCDCHRHAAAAALPNEVLYSIIIKLDSWPDATGAAQGSQHSIGSALEADMVLKRALEPVGKLLEGAYDGADRSEELSGVRRAIEALERASSAFAPHLEHLLSSGQRELARVLANTWRAAVGATPEPCRQHATLLVVLAQRVADLSDLAVLTTCKLLLEKMPVRACAAAAARGGAAPQNQCLHAHRGLLIATREASRPWSAALHQPLAAPTDDMEEDSEVLYERRYRKQQQRGSTSMGNGRRRDRVPQVQCCCC
jgi:hypothetical protein